MGKMDFKLNDTVILNNKAQIDLPMRVGQRAKVDEILHTSPNFDYDIKFDDGVIVPVRECELNKLTNTDEQFMNYIFAKNKVKYHDEEITIVKVDYLHKKAEIKIGDCEQVVDFKELQPIHINSLEEFEVSNSDRYKQLLQEKYDVYVSKNADYGNSFEDQFNEYGLLSAIIRLDDKLRRLKQLRNSEAKVKDESIRDTALDMANYADMLVMALDKLS
jgi:hypothetical protein